MSPYRHVEHLAQEIGSRPATSRREQQAHEYVQQVLDNLQIPVRAEEFRSIRSFTAPWMLTSLFFVLAGIFVWLGETVYIKAGAIGFSLLGGLFYWGLVSGMWDVQKLFPKGVSRNVTGMLSPSGEPKRRVLLIAHVDSTRACLLWHPKLVKNFGMSFRLQTFLLGLFVLSIFFASPDFSPWGFDLRWLTLPGLIISAWGIIVLIHRETVLDWVQGANDNASGVAVCLDVMEQLRKNPPQQTEVWAVFTGCEEVGAPVGAQEFFRKHAPELQNADILIVDNVGAGDPRYLTAEAMLPRRRAHPELLALAERLAKRYPDWNFQASSVPHGAYTDALPFMIKGCRCLALWSEKEGALPNWHWHTDTIERVKPEALEKMSEVVMGLVRAVDKSG